MSIAKAFLSPSRARGCLLTNTENRSHFKSVRSVLSMKMDMRCESLSIHKSNEKYSSGLRSEVYGLISLR